jgi:hypothetical protein
MGTKNRDSLITQNDSFGKNWGSKKSWKTCEFCKMFISYKSVQKCFISVHLYLLGVMETHVINLTTNRTK